MKRIISMLLSRTCVILVFLLSCFGVSVLFLCLVLFRWAGLGVTVFLVAPMVLISLFTIGFFLSFRLCFVVWLC